MRRFLNGRRPSPGLIVGVIALVVAIGGGSFALATSDSAKDKKIATKVAKKLDKKTTPVVAHSEISNSALSGTPSGSTETARQVNIRAPRRGNLHITASSDVFGGTGSLECAITVDGVRYDSTEREITENSNNEEDNCGTNGVVHVSGGTHTVKFQYDNRVSGTTVDETTLDVIWLP
jgi:hypothetical protein